MTKGKQVVVTVASGPHAEKLDYTFTSFARNPFLELHAFIVDAQLPVRRLPGVVYHLKAPDPAFAHPMRDMYYRRWNFVDELDAEFALVVDNADVLCLQPMPEIPALLRGAAVGAVVEHEGGRYLAGQKYTSCYLNAGVTFWHVPASREIRRKIVERGRARFRSVEDQLTLNEVLHTLYWDQLVILPSQFNYRADLRPGRKGWPAVDQLDGVVIYHNPFGIVAAKRLLPVKPRAVLPDLAPDAAPPTAREQFWRRLAHSREPHFMRASLFKDLLDARKGGLGRVLSAVFGKVRGK